MSENDQTSAALFQENIRLKKYITAHKLKSERFLRHPSIHTDDIVLEEESIPEEIIDIETADQNKSFQKQPDEEIKAERSWKYLKNLKVGSLFILVVLVIFVLLGYTFYQSKQYGDYVRSVSNIDERNIDENNAAEKLSATGIGEQRQFSVELWQQYLSTDCHTTLLKQSFPDVDYSLMGYNILQGFPLAVGHDPGFTLPIFVADYSDGGMTADCRYSVPKGLFVVPDVSCVTSFDSTTVQSQYTLAKSLSVSASVSGGGWGVSFSASSGYKSSSSHISTGEYVYIISTARCNYYFSKLMTESAPRFHSNFLKWIYILNSTNLSNTYFKFFNTYGTHFPTYVTYGARFTYEHRMQSSKYESETRRGVNVEAHASYSGFFSISGGFSMEESQRQSASSFAKLVTTKTITVGAAPPSNGDANTWASEVQSSPVPTTYKLESIELLFSDKYMGHLNVQHDHIATNIKNFQHDYCLHLKDQGKVDNCDSVSPGLLLKNTLIKYSQYAVAVDSSSQCLEYCLEHFDCIATSICTENCRDSICHIYKEVNLSNQGGTSTLSRTDTWEANIFPAKIESQLVLRNTAAIGRVRGLEDESDKQADQLRCHQLCAEDVYCVAYSHCKCIGQVSCKLYSETGITGLEREAETSTYFIASKYAKITTQTPISSTYTTTSTTTTTTTNSTSSG